ncbi:MAG: phage tail tape measure protein [Oscillospiraceae bacterium]|nr:phage tail tape measure protein [Oscillospiraceae bacterium]
MGGNRRSYELTMQLKAAKDANFDKTFSSSKDVIRNMQSQLNDFKKSQGDISAFQKSQSAIEQLNAKKKELANSSGDNTKAIEKLNQQIEKEELNLAKLGEKLDKAGVDTKNLATEKQRLGDEVDKLSQKQEKLATLENWQQKNSEALKAAQADFLKTTAVVAAAGAAFYKGFIEPAANFEEQASVVRAISGASQEEMRELNALAKEMGSTTKFTAVESGQAYEYMAMAGWESQQMMAGLPGIMNLAAASGEDLASVSDIVTDAMTAFNMTANESGRFADVLAATATGANTNVGMMGETFKQVAPLAGAMNYSIEDMSVAIGLMANAGIKGSMSGTALKNIMTNLVKPTDAVAASMDALDIKLENADGTAKSFEEVVQNLRDGFDGLSESEKSANAAAIAGKYGLSGLLALVNSSDEDFAKLTAQINNCNGAAKEMADIRLDNLKGDITLAKSAWDGFATTTGEIFVPAVREGVQSVTDMINRVHEWVGENPEAVKATVTTTSAIAGLTVAVKGAALGKLALAKEAKNLKILFTGGIPAAKSFAGSLAAIGPYGLIAAGAITIVTAAAIQHQKSIKALREQYADPLLFDNGGVKLRELTENLIENTKYQYENAQAVINSREELSGIRSEIQHASSDLDFYGRSLRENGTLSPSEAAAMYEPFNNLATALEDNFQIRYENVFEAFKIASGKVAEDLGVDVAHISGVLDGFNERYTGRMSESREVTNSIIERARNGEELTPEDYEALHKEMEFVRAMESATSEAAREMHRIQENINGIDFNDYDGALAEITRLQEFRDEYLAAMEEAHIALKDDHAELRRAAEVLYQETGDIKAYQAEIAAIYMSESMVTESMQRDVDEFLEEVRGLGGEIQATLLEAKGEIEDNIGYWDEVWTRVFTLPGANNEQKVQDKMFGEELNAAIAGAEELVNGTDLSLTLQAEINEAPAIEQIDELRKSIYADPVTLMVSILPQIGRQRGAPWREPVDGSHADGLDYVPYDGYIAELHRGERVLTAAESANTPSVVSASAVSSGGNTISLVYNPTINIEGNAPDNLKEILDEHSERIVVMVKDVLQEDAYNERRRQYGYPDINFVDTDTERLVNALIRGYEMIIGRTLFPGDPVRAFILWICCCGRAADKYTVLYIFVVRFDRRYVYGAFGHL